MNTKGSISRKAALILVTAAAMACLIAGTASARPTSASESVRGNGTATTVAQIPLTVPVSATGTVTGQGTLDLTSSGGTITLPAGQIQFTHDALTLGPAYYFRRSCDVAWPYRSVAYTVTGGTGAYAGITGSGFFTVWYIARNAACGTTTRIDTTFQATGTLTP